MQRHFDIELGELKKKILTMGGYVEKAIEESTQALLQREPFRFQTVSHYEDLINRAHLEVDEACLQLLARQAPMAADLRLVIAVIKINTDLERMGDQAVNISENGQRYLSSPALKPLIDLPKMAAEVRSMVRDSLDAFVRQDVALAREVIRRDDSVDSFKNQIFHDVQEIMSKTAGPTIEQGLNLILIARNLERLGDHATNIAEDVIFAMTGEDVRHKGSLEKASGAY
jgi:phosphate transport system protein